MNVLFLTLLDFQSLEERNLYTDLMREFVNDGHNVYIISPTEKRKQATTKLLDFQDHQILKLQIGNTQKTNIVEKGISTLTLEQKFIKGINKYFSNVRFDLVTYSTPPITLHKAIKYVKKRDRAKTYLLLKDIFPQNAVDLGMLKKNGYKSIVYKYFRSKEKKLYKISDYIGTMSSANMDYLMKHNPEIPTEIVEVCPNSIEPITINHDLDRKENIKIKYDLPLDKTIFVYGGNLGKPQGVEFLIECLESNKFNKQVYFVIAGSGTEFFKLRKYIEEENPGNVKLFNQLPRDEYEELVNACDVGLIFLDKRFTIPNFPSRLLSYMQASMPVLAATDKNTDVGKILKNGQFGYWCESSNVQDFNKILGQLTNKKNIENMGINARKYLIDNYTSRRSYEVIINHFK